MSSISPLKTCHLNYMLIQVNVVSKEKWFFSLLFKSSIYKCKYQKDENLEMLTKYIALAGGIVSMLINLKHLIAPYFL